MTARVLVIGGGMVGLAFAIAARRALPDSAIEVLEAHPFRDGNPNPLDTRASALNLVSRDILTRWQIWSAIAPSAGVIQKIHVSHQGHFGSSVMTPADVGEEQLGFVAENHTIGRAFKAEAERLGVVLHAPVSVASLIRQPGRVGIHSSNGDGWPADLVIIADGSDSTLREQLGVTVDRRHTGQRALVANVSFEGKQQGIAFERFTREGPMALLPLPSVQSGQQRFNLVWSMSAARAERFEQVSDDDFLAALQTDFGWRLGRALAVGKRSGWTLDRLRAREQVRPGVVVAGNAAHGIHPVAGQGLNLSLRDAATLGVVLKEANVAGHDPGNAGVLRRYEALVRADQDRTVGATDLLSTLFEPRGPLLDMPRNAALAGLDLVPPVRRLIARRGTGLDLAQVTDGGSHA